MRSWPRRPVRAGRGHRGRRGVSTVAGTIFFVVIMIMVITGLVVWSVQLQRRLSDLEARRLSQDLDVVIKFNKTITDAFNVTIRNNGPEAVKLVALWVICDEEGYHHRIDLSGQEVVIGPGEEWTYTVKYAWTPGHTYVVKVITSLGRVFATSETAPQTGP